MIIQNREVLNEWTVDSVSDFAQQFKLEKEICKKFNVSNIEDIYDCKKFEGWTDWDVIKEYLEKDSRPFEITVIDDNNIGCRWVFKEVIV